MLSHVMGTLRAAAVLLLLAACSGEDTPSKPAHVDETTQQKLAALGYAEWSEPGEGGELEQRSVTRHDPGRSFPGLNVYKSRGRRAALLKGMSGETLHAWRNECASQGEPPGWLERLDPRSWGRKRGPRGCWHWFELLPNGDLIGLAKWAHIERIDWNSRRLWRTPLTVHHDLDFDSEGLIYTLADVQDELTLADGETIPIVDDVIVILHPDDGRVLERIPLSPFFGSKVERAWVDSNKPLRFDAYDVFHTNSIEVVRQAVPGVAQVGDLLISLRELDLVAIFDPRARRVVWSWGPGELDRQHHPSFLPNGNILIFDNRPTQEASRVLELDPRSREIVWEHHASPPESFYSGTQGSSYALPNGNVLISESNRGHAFEITRNGDTVWEFWNPEVDGPREARATFYRFARLPLDYFEPGLLEEAMASETGSD